MQVNVPRRNERGVAMLLALMALVLVGGIAALMFARTLNEMRHSRDDTMIVQTLMLARGGANMGSALLGSDVHAGFREVVENTATPGRWAFGNDHASMSEDGPTYESVVQELNLAAARLQELVDDMLCGADIMPADSAGRIDLRIHFTEEACGHPLPVTVEMPDGRFVKGPPRHALTGIQEYAIPFVMISEGALGEYKRNIVMQGEYRFEVGQASFAQYAYFTNRETSDGGRIYFTGATMIDGPVHTNGNFSFADKSWFGGRVTSVGCQARQPDCRQNSREYGAFFNSRVNACVRRFLGFCVEWSNGFLSDTQMSPNSSAPVLNNDQPEFSDGVSWRAQYVALPDNAIDQEAVASGNGRLDRGLIFDNDLSSLRLWAGNQVGDQPNRNHQGDWQPTPTHQYVEACRLRPGTSVQTCEIWRYDSNKVLQRLPATGSLNDRPQSWMTQAEPFNGVIYVDGDVERFTGPSRPYNADGSAAAPALARFSEITLVAEGDVRITGDIRYEQPPCSTTPTRNANGTVNPAVCDNLNHPNVLGVYTPAGDIIVGNQNNDATLNAPNNVHVHSVLMSGTQQIKVENHNIGSHRGNFNLMGGMIQENRGIFGLFGSNNTGFSRVYTYDPRMRDGVAPPYFPTTGLDTVDAVRYFSFGQREQVY